MPPVDRPRGVACVLINKIHCVIIVLPHQKGVSGRSNEISRVDNGVVVVVVLAGLRRSPSN